MATGKESNKSSKRSARKQLSLEASLENLKELSSSLETKKIKKNSEFFISYDGRGKRITNPKYKYRSAAERAKNKKHATSGQCTSVTEVRDDTCLLDQFESTSGFDFDMDEESSETSLSRVNLTSCIANCEIMTKEMKASTPSVWTKRMQSVETVWENSRPAIFAAVLKSHATPTNKTACSSCMNDTAIVRCLQCGPSVLLCNSCDEASHKMKPLHDREIWINGFYQRITPTETVLSDGSLGFKKTYAPFLFHKECVYCQSQDTLSIIPSDEMCILVTANGRFDLYLFTYNCSGCGQQFSPLTLEKIICEGYWPGGPKNLSYVFHEDVFRLWDSVRKHMPGTSETAFIKSLASLSCFKGRSATINLSVFHRAFKEWCFAQHELDILQGKKWTDCPSCFGLQHSCHIDGNAKLYRYKCVPRGERKCYYDNAFIEDDGLVEEHLNKVYSNKSAKGHSNNFYCGSSSWKAARNTVNRQSKLDETGLVVAGCRHSLAQSAVNMHQGELYGYTHYLQINRLIENNVKFLWQDVICKYWPWFTALPKDLSPDKAFSMAPALSIMHGKAHVWSCQVTWGGRWQSGSGYTAGEEVEQINSYISRLGSTTKYMHAAGRNEALTEHVFHWNKLKILKLPVTLCKKHVYIKMLIAKNKTELEELVSQLNLSTNSEDFENWAAEITACGQRSLTGDYEMTKRELDLVSFCELYNEINEAVALKPFLDVASNVVGVEMNNENANLFSQASAKCRDLDKKEKEVKRLELILGICESEMKRKALEEGRNLLAKKKIVSIREEIEMLCFSISQRKKNISRLADSSKQRAKLRSKNAAEKKKLDYNVEQYNIVKSLLKTDLEDITSDGVLDGNFPWIDQDDKSAAMSLRIKRRPVEVYLTGKRLEEELGLLENEMHKFLCYYKDNVLPNLEARLHFINNDDMLGDMMDEAGLQSEQGKYKASCSSRLAIAGETALIKSGMFFCMNILKEAVAVFKSMIEGTLNVDEFVDSEAEEDEDVEEIGEDEDLDRNEDEDSEYHTRIQLQ